MLQLRGAGEAESRGGDRATSWPGWILEARSWPRGLGARGAGARESRAERPRAGSSGGRGFGPHRAARARLGQQSRQVLHQVPLLLDLLCGEGGERAGGYERRLLRGAIREQAARPAAAAPRSGVPGPRPGRLQTPPPHPAPMGSASTPRPRPATVPPPVCPQVPPQPSQRPRPSQGGPAPPGSRPRPVRDHAPTRVLSPPATESPS